MASALAATTDTWHGLGRSRRRGTGPIKAQEAQLCALCAARADLPGAGAAERHQADQ